MFWLKNGPRSRGGPGGKACFDIKMAPGPVGEHGSYDLFEEVSGVSRDLLVYWEGPRRLDGDTGAFKTPCVTSAPGGQSGKRKNPRPLLGLKGPLYALQKGRARFAHIPYRAFSWAFPGVTGQKPPDRIPGASAPGGQCGKRKTPRAL